MSTSRITRLMEKYGCTESEAQHYLDLREEGHSTYHALVLSGLTDPDDVAEKQDYSRLNANKKIALRLKDDLEAVGFVCQEVCAYESHIVIEGGSSVPNVTVFLQALKDMEARHGVEFELRASSIYGNECLSLDATIKEKA